MPAVKIAQGKKIAYYPKKWIFVQKVDFGKTLFSRQKSRLKVEFLDKKRRFGTVWKNGQDSKMSWIDF